jgi:glycerol kinase
VYSQLQTAGVNLITTPLKAVGITNQRETTIAWNSETGDPYYNAIVWDDLRTTSIAEEIAKGNPDRFRSKTGLPLASYFSGTKVKWLLDNVPKLQEDLRNHPDVIRFGTMDTWLAYNLTGKERDDAVSNVGGTFITDVTNASRWLFMDLKTLQWDKELIDEICAPHNVPLTALPEIKSSSEVYATLSDSGGVPCLATVPLASILGDQQSALFGQSAYEPGEGKCTYGTGLFLMMNTGSRAVYSTHGLLTTVGYQLGEGGEVTYALEGSVSHAGSTIQWLRDSLQIIKDAAECESLASETNGNEGVYVVPAFAGLFAPHWRPDARACIVGMTATHTKHHIVRGALEATSYQAREVFEAIDADARSQKVASLKELKVDGGGTNNSLMMQFTSDMISVDVIKPVVMETTAIGAAFAAGLAVGVWESLDEIKSLWAVARTFNPSMSEEDRSKNWKGWKKAVERSLGWVESEEQIKTRAAKRARDRNVTILTTAIACLATFVCGVYSQKPSIQRNFTLSP